MHRTLLKPALFLLLAIILLSAQAQQRQGNIVEYFGKEKVNNISEGTLLHVFQQGLVLAMPSARLDLNSSSSPEDPVFARYLLQGESDIEEGKTFDISFKGEALQWERLEVDSANTFEDSRLRSGYLYLSYDSPSKQTVLLEVSGPTGILVNGLPHEGDHYDFGWNLIPLQLKKGKNEFLFNSGRFSRMRARLIAPSSPRQFTLRDLTLPDVLPEEAKPLLGAIRILNAQESAFAGGTILCASGDVVAESQVPVVTAFHQRKVPFTLPVPALETGQEEVRYQIILKDNKGKTLDTDTLTLNVKSLHKHHKRTFLSGIDGSVQYYSVAPCSNPDLKKPALFLSVHGASVEATNQANAYKQKDWGHLVAPTNRRPFGFAWEDWGRLDALEVLADAEKTFQTDPERTYLTGHSMGGHGTWYLGATYPDRWAAIAPCAGYPDLMEYRGGFSRRMQQMSEEQLARFGMTKADVERMLSTMPGPFDEIVTRAGNPSRTLKLKDNYNHFGVYILHGEYDRVVPTEIARSMRKLLGEFHSDFTYYEYPQGTHWYGDHSVDWHLIFDFFKERTLPRPQDRYKLSFHTASPGVSASSNFIVIEQQEIPFEISSFNFVRNEKVLSLETENVYAMSADLARMGIKNGQKLEVDGQEIAFSDTSATLHLFHEEGEWATRAEAPPLSEKGPHRNGGFKDAFRHHLVLVYATGGSAQENTWYYNKARYDAEAFWYRANGNVEMVADVDFSPEAYPDRNVILYGNRDNNSAWTALLKDSPLQVKNGELSMAGKTLSGSQWGGYFLVPRSDSDLASVGVVTATGPEGMKATYANHYLLNGTTFPDVMIFDGDFLSRGRQGLKCAGFWGNDWSVEKGEFVWR